LPRYNLEQLTQLVARVDLPIAGGELNIGLHEYRHLIESNCYDIIQADAAFSEGVFQLRKVAALAEMHYKPFIPHTWSNGIGLGANLHLAASVPNCPWFEFPVDPPAWQEESRDFMLAEPYTINADGTISVPESPGFGFKLNWDAIRESTIEMWESGGAR
jgi:L-alanine-DL-glutamate epimerase-like enolase superfamily enzyme